MKRRVSSDEIKNHIRKLRQAAPKIPITTHVLVGFPGETNKDFDQTVKLLHEIDFEYICAFTYTDRPGTPASQFSEKVTRLTKVRRLLALKNQFKTKQPNQFSYFNKPDCRMESKIEPFF